MIWPKSTDYAEAVQNLRTSMTDEELRKGEVACNSLGLPMPWVGNFADVYQVHCPATGNTWALKCFTRQVRGLQDRYRRIAAHLDEARLPFTVDFQYLEQGILIAGQRFPVLKMRWVEGQTLTQFVEEQLDRPRNLQMLLDLWVKLAARLRKAQVAHADLQHGNVLLVPASGGSLALRLIDYDGMHVPTLAGTRSGEVGHPAYQHPQRLREGTYGIDVDRFSHLAIYGSVYCLSIGGRTLWDRFNNGDNLLFRESDFHDPGRSDLFRALWELDDADARALTCLLIWACLRPLEKSPLLDEIIADGHVRPLSPSETSAMESLLLGQSAIASLPPAPPPRVRLGREAGPTGAAGAVAEPVDPNRASWENLPLPVEDTGGFADARPGRVRGARRATARFLLAKAQGLDRRLGAFAGEGNDILHNFLRVAAVLTLAAGLLLVAGLLFRTWQSKPAGELAAAQLAVREAARIKAEAKEEAARIEAKARAAAARIKGEAKETLAAERLHSHPSSQSGFDRMHPAQSQATENHRPEQGRHATGGDRTGLGPAQKPDDAGGERDATGPHDPSLNSERRDGSHASVNLKLPSGAALTDDMLTAPADWRNSLFPQGVVVFNAASDRTVEVETTLAQATVVYVAPRNEAILTTKKGSFQGPAAIFCDGGLALARYKSGERDGPVRQWAKNGERVLYADYKFNVNDGLTCLFHGNLPWLVQDWRGRKLQADYLVKWERSGSRIIPRDQLAEGEKREYASALRELADVERQLGENEVQWKQTIRKWYASEDKRLKNARRPALAAQSRAAFRARSEARAAEAARNIDAFWRRAWTPN